MIGIVWSFLGARDKMVWTFEVLPFATATVAALSRRSWLNGLAYLLTTGFFACIEPHVHQDDAGRRRRPASCASGMARVADIGWNRRVTTIRIGLVLGTCLLAVGMARPARVDGADQPRIRWWLDPAVQQELALTQAQVQALQSTFERGLSERLAVRRELDRLDTQLQQLLERGDDDDRVARFSTRVERVRAKRNVSRTLVLLEMYRILTPAQRRALSRLRALDAGQTPGTGAALAAPPR